MDLSKEDPKIREMYGDGKPFKFQYDGAPTVNEHVLMARRLVSAGARSVTLSYGRWDSHGSNFDLVRDHGAKLDQCVSALVRDLDQRGMLDDTTGEALEQREHDAEHHEAQRPVLQDLPL